MRLRKPRISLRRVKRLRRHFTAPQAPRKLPRPPEEILVVIRGKVVNVQHSTPEDFVIKESVLRLKVEQRPLSPEKNLNDIVCDTSNNAITAIGFCRNAAVSHFAISVDFASSIITNWKNA